jgi:hypothetical protein
MNKFLFLLCILAGLSYSCINEKDIVSKDLPACMESKRDSVLRVQPTKPLVIKRFSYKENYHYWFNDGSLTYDGEEYIYDEKCGKPICSYCGKCARPNCFTDYPFYNADVWETVWTK